MTRTFAVPDVSCDHCQRAIEGEVGQLDGVTTVQVDLESKTVTVEGDVADDAIIAAIDEAGYEVAGV